MVVIRWVHRPGLVIRANNERPCLAEKRIISYETEAMTGNSSTRMPKRGQNLVTGMAA